MAAMPAVLPTRARCIGFAHRGASADARENTLEAFALALRLGATGLESDVWISADGVPVLDHDGLMPDGVPFREVERAALPPHVPSLRELDPKIRLVDSTRVSVMRTAPPERAERMAALGIDALNLHWSDWSESLASAFRAHGRRLLAWDAQDEPSLARVLALGVDGVFSDHVARMMRAIRA